MSNVDRIHKILNSKTSQVAVNEDFNLNINLENNNRPIPLNDVVKTISQSEIFDNERTDSNKYMFLGSIRQIISNVLFNIKGPDSLETVQGIVNNSDDITIRSVRQIINEVDGWFSYKNTTCTTIELSPKKQDLLMINNGVNDNWTLKITYPYTGDSNNLAFYSNADNFYPVYLKDGIAINSVRDIIVGGKDMTLIESPIKHGLVIGDRVKIEGNATYDGEYRVVKLGDENGDNLKNQFVIDFTVPTQNITNSYIRFKRIVNNRVSKYMVRIFKTLIDSNNIDFYYTSFSKTLYNDDVITYNTKLEVDLSNYTDYLGRPLTEVYLTTVKNKTGASNAFWADLIAGIQTSVVGTSYDIRQINALNLVNDLGLVLSSDNEFFGDIVDYNEEDLSERTLEMVNHTFNTLNRVANNYFEGYYYSPHKKITLAYYSNQIEYNDNDFRTINIPTYAINLNGRTQWKDILSKGYFDELGRGVDYPFLNNINYVYSNMFLSVKRQDPDRNYSIGNNPPYIGLPCNINGIEKDPQDVC